MAVVWCFSVWYTVRAFLQHDASRDLRTTPTFLQSESAQPRHPYSVTPRQLLLVPAGDSDDGLPAGGRTNAEASRPSPGPDGMATILPDVSITPSTSPEVLSLDSQDGAQQLLTVRLRSPLRATRLPFRTAVCGWARHTGVQTRLLTASHQCPIVLARIPRICILMGACWKSRCIQAPREREDAHNGLLITFHLGA